MPELPDASTTKALQDGAQRSLEASRAAGPLHPLAVLWRRHKWKILALVLFGLLDLAFFGGFFRGHF